MDISSTLLRQFVAIADAGTLAGAAEHLEMSPSALSRALQRFEEQTQLVVFRRVGARFEPTAVGSDLLAAVRRVVGDLDLVTTIAADAAGASTGTITIACPPGVASWPLPELVSNALHARPGIEVDIDRVESSFDAAESLRSGRSELALVPRLSTPTDLEGFHLGRHEMTLIIPAAWTIPMDADGTVGHDLARLGVFPFIAGRSGTSSNDAMLRLRNAGARPRTVVTNAPAASVPGLVASGIGAAIVTRRLALGADTDSIRILELSPPLNYPITLMHRPGERSPLVALFLQIAETVE